MPTDHDEIITLKEHTSTHEKRLSALEKQFALRKVTCPYKEKIDTLDILIQQSIEKAFDKLWLKVYGYLLGTVVSGAIMAYVVSWIRLNIGA